MLKAAKGTSLGIDEFFGRYCRVLSLRPRLVRCWLAELVDCRLVFSILKMFAEDTQFLTRVRARKIVPVLQLS